MAELDELHEAVVADMAGSATVLPAGAETHVGTANATDAVITFKLPAKPAVFGFATQVRKTPGWPRSWANSSLL